jgi:hypothetical protein
MLLEPLTPLRCRVSQECATSSRTFTSTILTAPVEVYLFPRTTPNLINNRIVDPVLVYTVPSSEGGQYGLCSAPNQERHHPVLVIQREQDTQDDIPLKVTSVAPISPLPMQAVVAVVANRTSKRGEDSSTITMVSMISF